MGRRGPPKTPTNTLKQRGTFRRDRHGDEVDIELAPSLPDPPEHFDDEQRELWNSIGTRLKDRGLMTELDAQAFELLIGAYVGMRQAQDALSNDSLIVYVGESGTPIANPLVNIISKHVATVKWCLTQFGCTPSARNGVKPVERKKQTTDPMAALLAGMSAPSPPPAGKPTPATKKPAVKKPAKRKVKAKR